MELILERIAKRKAYNIGRSPILLRHIETHLARLCQWGL